MPRRSNNDETLSELAEVLGADPPMGMASLTSEETTTLVEAIRAAQRHQHEEVRRAESELIHQVPRPLRGTVKRMLR